MKTLTAMTAMTALSVMVVAGCAHSKHQMSEMEPAKTESYQQKMDIVDTAISAGKFNTLVAAVKAAGLVETLKSEGPFTVFAPTDQAFEMLPEGALSDLLKPENKEKLRAVLTYHVVAGKVMAEDAMQLQSAKTVQGESLQIRAYDGKVTIDGATVINADIETSNGVIHVIDSVILPRN